MKKYNHQYNMKIPLDNPVKRNQIEAKSRRQYHQMGGIHKGVYNEK